MRNCLRSPLFRCLVCLLLVCCILVNVSPIRAKALAVGGTISAVVGTAAAVSCVACAIQALGVLPNSNDTSVFEGVVNDCVAALTDSGVLVNGLVSVLQLSDGVHVKNHVNEGIIQAILDWLFANDVVEENAVSVPSGYWLYNGLQYKPLPDYDSSTYPYAAIYFNDSTNKTILVLSSLPLGYSKKNSALTSDLINPHSENVSYMVSYYSTGSWGDFTSGTYAANASILTYKWDCVWKWANYDVMKSDISECILSASEPVKESYSEIAVAAGLVAGQIGTNIKTDYETWVEDGVIAVDFGIGYIDDPNTHEDDDEDDDTGTEISPTTPPGELEPVLPDTQVAPTTTPSPWWYNNKWLNLGSGFLGWELGAIINHLLTETQTETQTAVADPGYQVDTSLFGNGGNGNNVVVTDPTVPSDPTTPSNPDISVDFAMTFDLKNFFPFCIPFDLYDFFNVLDAPPEAPQFHWELQDLSGNIYPIDIDLSAWDEVASLFRKFQLFLFVIGLAAATRKYIKW